MNKSKSLNQKDLNPNDAAYPCGHMAYTFFNDRFRIEKVEINEDDLLWESDRELRY